MFSLFISFGVADSACNKRGATAAIPAFETLFQKFLHGKSPVIPDGMRLHSLIFRRIVQWTTGEWR
jgi:hypothetical protein